jgi:hypothetical protein
VIVFNSTTQIVQNERMEKVFYADTNQKRVQGAKYTDKTDFKSKTVVEDKEEPDVVALAWYITYLGARLGILKFKISH